MSASRTTPTLCVLVSAIGVVSRPDSRTHSSPVSSPLPLSVWQPANSCSRADVGLARDDHRHAGPHVLALDQRDRADAHAGDVRDRVERPGVRVAEPDAELAGAHRRTLAQMGVGSRLNSRFAHR